MVTAVKRKVRKLRQVSDKRNEMINSFKVGTYKKPTKEELIALGAKVD